MKKVKLNKKLQFNKETIARLDNEKLDAIHGGDIVTRLSVCTPCTGTCPNPCQSHYPGTVCCAIYIDTFRVN
jgi:hypothetical protein